MLRTTPSDMATTVTRRTGSRIAGTWKPVGAISASGAVSTLANVGGACPRAAPPVASTKRIACDGLRDLHGAPRADRSGDEGERNLVGISDRDPQRNRGGLGASTCGEAPAAPLASTVVVARR